MEAYIKKEDHTHYFQNNKNLVLSFEETLSKIKKENLDESITESPHDLEKGNVSRCLVKNQVISSKFEEERKRIINGRDAIKEEKEDILIHVSTVISDEHMSTASARDDGRQIFLSPLTLISPAGQSAESTNELKVDKPDTSEEKTLDTKKPLNKRFRGQTDPFGCEHCGKYFTAKHSLVTHIRTHTGEKPYKCKLCGKCFIRKTEFRVHARTHTGEKPYKCEFCEKCFVSKGQLTNHTPTHTGEKKFSCEWCGKSFARKAWLTHHIMKHTGEKPFKCERCDKRFITKQDMNVHTWTHTGEKPYSNDSCGKNFSRKAHLKEHKVDNPDKSEEKTLTTKKPLNRRFRGQTDPFGCEHCGKYFTTKHSLVTHIRTHTGEKPYKCELCGKCFTTKTGLTVHTRTHTGEKPYKCEFCKKCFTMNSQLTNHIRTHTGEKPFNCGRCEKSFSRKAHLKQHIMTHTGEKPF